MKTLVIGYGNNSRRDDGVGWRVVERVQELGLPDVECLTLHQLEVDLAETVLEHDRVIFVDAAIPEASQLITRAAVQANFQSHAVAHYLTPADLLALSRLLYGAAPAGELFSIRGTDFNFGDELTPAVARAADAVVAQITQLVTQSGAAVHA